MASSSARIRLMKVAHALYLQRVHPHALRLTIGAATVVLLVILGTLLLSRSPPAPTADSVRLFIAIGSAPHNEHLRRAARETWLSWLPSDNSVAYRFFTDAPPPTRTAYSLNASLWRSIAREHALHADVVQQPLPSGYGDNEHNAYGRRALFQAHYSVGSFPQLRHFLRIDDDSFLCLHRLLYELGSAPAQQFFWGRFWCRSGRNRADENFMLFSADVARLLADDSLTGLLIPFDPSVTLGWNFGYWSWTLNLTIFDDQDRLDAQQGYLTTYMHEDPNGSVAHAGAPASEQHKQPFCDTYMYAHHVPELAMRAAFENTRTHLMYPLPVRRHPRETCKQAERSFISARHSSRLPNIKVEAVDAGNPLVP